MKYLLLLLVILWGVWLLSRKLRRPSQAHNSGDLRAVSPARAEEMSACAQCGLHAGQSTMIQGERGWYCTAQHMAQAQDRARDPGRHA